MVMTEKQLEFKILKLNKEISNLNVLIDTLQTNLRSAVSQIPEDKVESITKVRSYQWCSNWRPENGGEDRI
jgi:hypothetical protein